MSLFLSQLNFIYSDPDLNISYSRGPWSDEGLNTCQIRNFIHSNDLTLSKSDNFVKTPMFGSILYLPYKLFGTSQSIGRLTILILCVLSMLFISKINNYFKKLITLVIPFVLFQYHIFHFTHFSMAEILSTISIFIGLIFLYRSMGSKKENKSNTLLACLFLSISYFLKIQFLYIIFLFPTFLILLLILSKFIDISFDFSLKKLIKNHIYYIILFGLIYLTCWYIPNKELLDYVMTNQTTGRFIEFQELNIKGVILDFLITFYNKTLYVNELKVFFFTFCLAIIIGTTFLFNKSSKKNFKILFLLALAWFIIETHKFSMLYLPNRYLISFYFSMGLIICLTALECFHLFKAQQKNIAFFVLPYSISLIFLLLFNGLFYTKALNRRTYQISKISSQLKNYDFKDRPIIGAWAPAISWETTAKSYPIWNNYFNYTEIIKNYSPKIIVLEPNETTIYNTFKYFSRPPE